MKLESQVWTSGELPNEDDQDEHHHMPVAGSWHAGRKVDTLIYNFFAAL
jgi:hypothetical protein